jgi:hypothetical protein
MVSGTIYIRPYIPAPARQVMIQVKGTEKVSWMDSETHNVDGRQETRQVKRKAEREIMHFENPCYVISVP